MEDEVDATKNAEIQTEDRKINLVYGPADDSGPCYDDETEVLTEDGWKLFKSIIEQDKICTLNPDTHIIEYQTPISTTAHQYNGELYTYGNNSRSSIDFAVTPYHRMYIRPVLKGKKKDKYISREVCNIPFTSVIKRNGAWIGEDREWFELGNFRCRMEDWCAFLGIWIAEGWAGIKNGPHYRISIIQNNQDPKIQEVLDRLPIKFTYFKGWSNRGNFWEGSNKEVVLYLMKLGKSLDKYVPKEIKQLPAKYLKILLDFLLLGDGTHWPRSSKVYYTSSKRLADDIQELLLKVGTFGNLKIVERKKPTKFSAGNPEYKVIERVNHKSESTLLKNRIVKVPYDGVVYCCEVPNHIIYVRRNGKPMWCQQSFHHIKIPANYLNSKGLCNAAWGWEPSMMDKADIIVVQRQISPDSLNFVRERKRQGKTIIYTIGDNMFQLPPHSPVFYYYSPQVIKTGAAIMNECHAITTTTPYLAKQLSLHSGNQNVHIVPHLIAKEHINKIAPREPTDEVRIGWTTTPYHIGDWPICSHAIKDICKKYPQVKIIFWGFINEDMSSYVPKDQLEFYSWVDVLEYYNCLVSMDLDIGIAPLEDTPYNNAKSPLKFVEYGMLGIPGIYSPTPPYDTVVHLEAGLKPKKNRYREWYRWLEYLIENRDERYRIGMNAQKYILEHHEGYKMIDRYFEVYMEVHNRVQKGWNDIGLKDM